MRAPSDLPRRRRRKRSSNRGRIVLIVAAVLLLFLFLSLRGIAGFYTDYLWFHSLGFTSVWRGVLFTKIALAVVFTLAFAVLLWSNLLIADRIAPRFRPAGPEEEFVQRYQELIGRRTTLVRIVVSLVFGLIAGVGVSGEWREWLLFSHSVSFNKKDPLFRADISFYVFRLPFWRFLVGWLFAAVVIIIVVTAVAHYLNGGIRVQTSGQRVTPQVKAHLSVLLAGLAALKAVGYWLQRYGLTVSTRGFTDGAGFTDVKAQLPAIYLLIMISLTALVILIINIRKRGWILPIVAVGLWGFVAVVAGAIYPAFVQRVRVQPDESTKERPYIARNISATQQAFGLDKVSVEDFNLDNSLTPAEVAANTDTLRNVRLLDPNVVLRTFQRLQSAQSFYEFNDLDVDRYPNGNTEGQVVISTRELNQANLPVNTWESRHLAYTHGYGVATAPASSVTQNGSPAFQLRNLPIEGTPPVTTPQVYFGENLDAYAIVGTKRDEIDYTKSDGTEQTSRYAAGGGVAMNSLLRKLAFSLRFGDFNPLFSNFITSSSKILYVRDIGARVRLLAPFLDFDGDPYPVVIQGRIVWVVDAYTTTMSFPYSQRADTGQLTGGTTLNHGFNYIRNSVKAVIDAYTGDVRFYVVDPTDPIVQAWAKAFPKLFTSGDQMPEELRAHLRYPEDMFRVQTNMWGRYHVTDPKEFYSRSDAWNVAQNPGTQTGVSNTTQTTDAQGNLGRSRELRVDPYYLLMKLPNEQSLNYVLLRPFVRFSDDDSRKELIAFMTAKSDPADYGKLQVFETRSLPKGPALIASDIANDPTIASELTLLDQRGSQVLQGNLLLVPVANSLLYVRPLYVQAEQTPVPELKKVIVDFNGKLVMQDTLEQALAGALGVPVNFNSTVPDQTAGGGSGNAGAPGGGNAGSTTVPSTGGTGTTVSPPTTGVQTVAGLLARADELFSEADQALAAKDLATYQAKLDQARKLIQQAAALAGVPIETTTVPGSAPSGTESNTTVASA